MFRNTPDIRNDVDDPAAPTTDAAPTIDPPPTNEPEALAMVIGLHEEKFKLMSGRKIGYRMPLPSQETLNKIDVLRRQTKFIAAQWPSSADHRDQEHDMDVDDPTRASDPSGSGSGHQQLAEDPPASSSHNASASVQEALLVRFDRHFCEMSSDNELQALLKAVEEDTSCPLCHQIQDRLLV